MIGLAADVLLLFNGDILGASGIVSSVALQPMQTLKDASQHWKVVFLAGFMSTTAIVLVPRYQSLMMAASPSSDNSRALSSVGLAVAGALVGFGTKLGNGCTSGHGICGLARRSRRSLAAVATFMATGILTTFLTSRTSRLSHLTEFLRRRSDDEGSSSSSFTSTGMYLTAAMVAAAFAAPFFQRYAGKLASKDDRSKLVPAAVAGSLFATGLYVSTMVVQGKVLGFLDLSLLRMGRWDPTLACVMGGGLLVSTLGYLWKSKLSSPLCLCRGSQFSLPTSQAIDWQLVAGAACFGAGWGIAGYCPGPAVFLAIAGVPGMLTIWWPAFVAGSYVGSEMKRNTQC